MLLAESLTTGECEIVCIGMICVVAVFWIVNR